MNSALNDVLRLKTLEIATSDREWLSRPDLLLIPVKRAMTTQLQPHPVSSVSPADLFPFNKTTTGHAILTSTVLTRSSPVS